ncbi:MAG: hypothetical protein AAF224_03830 [Pseudomonadota bacterium]
MAKFMLAHLDDGAYGGGRILTPETTRRMRAPLYRTHDGLSAILHGFREEEKNGRFGYGHRGSTTYFKSDMVLLPEEGVGLFASTNSGDGFSVVNPLFKAFFDQYFPSANSNAHPAPENPKTPGGADASSLSRYTGAYRSTRRSYTKWEKPSSYLAAIQ